MKDDVIQRLVAINGEFYQSFGAAFAETRRRIQPGVDRVLTTWITDGSWLDLGCGSGALSLKWIEKGLRGKYTGLDFSDPLLSEARIGIDTCKPPPGLDMRFIKANLMDRDWENSLKADRFDGILAFASLHHLPGASTRIRVLRQAADLLKPGGLFIHSEWQFQNSPKLAARVQPWSLAGLSEAEVDPGDALLDWRRQAQGQPDAAGLRYVHLFNRDELAQLAADNGFTLLDEFESDGAGGNLGLYQVWKKLDADQSSSE
jgi:tRNA (uracil-5-)-methyltransferase TRM9